MKSIFVLALAALLAALAAVTAEAQLFGPSAEQIGQAVAQAVSQGGAAPQIIVVPQQSVTGEGASYHPLDYNNNRDVTELSNSNQNFLILGIIAIAVIVLIAAVYIISGDNRDDVLKGIDQLATVTANGFVLTESRLEQMRQFNERHTDPAIQALVRNQEDDNRNQNTRDAQRNTADTMKDGVQLGRGTA